MKVLNEEWSLSSNIPILEINLWEMQEINNKL